MRYHLDTDFPITALGTTGPERARLHALAASDAQRQMSAVAWYEFARGPRRPEQLADDLDDEERAELHAALDEGLAESR